MSDYTLKNPPSVFDDGEIYQLARKHDITDHDEDWACDERVLDFAYELEQLVYQNHVDYKFSDMMYAVARDGIPVFVFKCKKMAEHTVALWQQSEPARVFVLREVHLEPQLFDHVYKEEENEND